jgi:hypothetical protein
MSRLRLNIEASEEDDSMGYYMRVLTLSPNRIPRDELQDALNNAALSFAARLEPADGADWENLHLLHDTGGAIAALEFNPVAPGTLGEEEIREFLESTSGDWPKCGAQWLEAFLPRVKAIYAFQVLHGAGKFEDGWEAIGVLMELIRQSGAGITQADGEGFSNMEGDHILWQFSEGASGTRRMAVLKDGLWTSFIMEMGNTEQREAFLCCEVPAGAEVMDTFADDWTSLG